MPIPVAIPRLGWNMEEGIFVEWLKANGDTVRAGDAVFKLESEKATEEIESLDSGRLHIAPDAPKPGDRVAVGAVIGYLLVAGETADAAQAGSTSTAIAAPTIQTSDTPKQRTSVTASPSHIVTPRARRLAARLGVDVALLSGSGANGRIRERDIPHSDRVIPLTPMRRAIANRMMESRQTTAPVTLTSVVDATNLVNLREQYKAVANSAAVPSYTDFLVKLSAVALQQHPLLAARWTDSGIAFAERIDIGIAVDTNAGLLVPVIRDAPTLGLKKVATRSRELIDRARRGDLSSGDMQGACFTITNLGAFGIDAFTPIINPPECAILGVGRIKRQPVMEEDRVFGRELVTLSLTFDHRIVDGAPAARFLQTLATFVENPAPCLST